MLRTSAGTLFWEPNAPVLFAGTDTLWMHDELPFSATRMASREQRIRRALGGTNKPIPRVNEASLFTYYRYLLAKTSRPFVAHFPMPVSPQEDMELRCVVVKLLDPRRNVGNAWDGIFCLARTPRGEIKLALIDLYLSEESPEFQFIDDYWYWFWNWQ